MDDFYKKLFGFPSSSQPELPPPSTAQSALPAPPAAPAAPPAPPAANSSAPPPPLAPVTKGPSKTKLPFSERLAIIKKQRGIIKPEVCVLIAANMKMFIEDIQWSWLNLSKNYKLEFIKYVSASNQFKDFQTKALDKFTPTKVKDLSVRPDSWIVIECLKEFELTPQHWDAMVNGRILETILKSSNNFDTVHTFIQTNCWKSSNEEDVIKEALTSFKDLSNFFREKLEKLKNFNKGTKQKLFQDVQTFLKQVFDKDGNTVILEIPTQAAPVIKPEEIKTNQSSTFSRFQDPKIKQRILIQKKNIQTPPQQNYETFVVLSQLRNDWLAVANTPVPEDKKEDELDTWMKQMFNDENVIALLNSFLACKTHIESELTRINFVNVKSDIVDLINVIKPSFRKWNKSVHQNKVVAESQYDAKLLSEFMDITWQYLQSEKTIRDEEPNAVCHKQK